MKIHKTLISKQVFKKYKLMKTSNKLLLGLLIFIILGVIIVNVVYKIKLDTKQKNRIEFVRTNDSISNEQDSLAMEKAIYNQ